MPQIWRKHKKELNTYFLLFQHLGRETEQEKMAKKEEEEREREKEGKRETRLTVAVREWS